MTAAPVLRRRRDRRGPARRGAWNMDAAAAWNVDLATAAAKLATNWKKKVGGTIDNGDIQVYICIYRAGDVAAPKNEGKQMDNKQIKTYDLEFDLNQVRAWIKDLRDRQLIAIDKGITSDGRPLVNSKISKGGTHATIKQILQVIEDWADRLKEHAAAAQKQETII